MRRIALRIKTLTVFTVVLLGMLMVISAGLWAEDVPLAARHWIDFRCGLDLGPFLYAQTVDGGYYVNGVPYNLNWYSLQGEVLGIIELTIPAVTGLGLGIGGDLFMAFYPVAMDDNAQVSVHSNANAFGGYGGASVSYTIDKNWRLNGIAGYGGTGIAKYYGGSGLALSAAIDYLFPKNNIVAGIGVRFLYMYLYYPSIGSTRSENGSYMAFTAEAALDWLP